MSNIVEQFRSAPQGSLVTVNDPDLIIELGDEPEAKSKRPDFLIKEKRHFRRNSEGFEVMLLDHVGSDLEYLLVCSYFKDAADIKIYTKPGFFTPDSREVLIKSDNSWLFDGDSYPQEIYAGDNTFTKKIQDEVFGNDCIVEWTTEASIVDYQLLVIETGSFNTKGGWVEFWEGRQIREKDVTF